MAREAVQALPPGHAWLCPSALRDIWDVTAQRGLLGVCCKEKLTPPAPVRCCEGQEAIFSFPINSPSASPQHLLLSFLHPIQESLQFPSSLVVHELLPNAGVEAPGELPPNGGSFRNSLNQQ